MDLLLVTWIVIVSVAGVICLLINKLIVYVPPNHVMVVVDSNGQKKVKNHGYRLVLWPFEHPVQNNWSYHTVTLDGTPSMVHYHSIFVPTQVISMDTPSYQVTDRFGVVVDVDVIFRFSITNPILAVSVNDNLYSFLEDCVETGTYQVINAMDYKDTIGQNTHIAEQMKRAINKQIEPCGCVVMMLVVQNIEPDKNLGETVQQQSVDAQKAHIRENQLVQERRLAEREREDAEYLARIDHENRLKGFERQLVLAHKSVELAEVTNQETSLKQDVAARIAQIEQSRRLSYMSELKTLGFSNTEIIQIVNNIEIAREMAVSLGQNAKIIISPENYQQLLTLSLFPASSRQ